MRGSICNQQHAAASTGIRVSNGSIGSAPHVAAVTHMQAYDLRALHEESRVAAQGLLD